MERAFLLVVWRNLVKRSSERDTHSATPAMTLGLTKKPWSWPRVLARRLFPWRVPVPPSWMKIYRRTWITAKSTEHSTLLKAPGRDDRRGSISQSAHHHGIGGRPLREERRWGLERTPAGGSTRRGHQNTQGAATVDLTIRFSRIFSRFAYTVHVHISTEPPHREPVHDLFAGCAPPLSIPLKRALWGTEAGETRPFLSVPGRTDTPVPAEPGPGGQRARTASLSPAGSMPSIYMNDSSVRSPARTNGAIAGRLETASLRLTVAL
jgi:hypothetical protein